MDPDLTTGKCSQEAAAEMPAADRETLLRVFTDNLAAGMVYQIDSGTDGKQRILSYLSPAVEGLHGLTVAEVKRNPLLLYEQVIEEDRLLLAEREDRAFAALAPLDIEVRVRLPSGDIRWRHFKSAPRTLPDRRVVWDGIELDVTKRKHAELALRESEEKLKQKNAALKEILAQIEAERMETRKLVTANIESFAKPIIEKMRLNARPRDRKYLNMLELGLQNIISQFGIRINGPHALSARESEICNMIRSGLSTKEIAQMLAISLRTVDTFRNRIRRKLGIARKDVNLYAHLQALAGGPAFLGGPTLAPSSDLPDRPPRKRRPPP